ncbi:MAG TPA: hypothetical protein VEA63_04385 [Opitutus sp.]|nr:hypothetical protein [Opitutus sp.]
MNIMETLLLRFMRVVLTAAGLSLPAIGHAQFYIEAGVSAAGVGSAQFERRSAPFSGDEIEGAGLLFASVPSLGKQLGLRASYHYVGDTKVTAGRGHQPDVLQQASGAVVYGLAPELRWAAADQAEMAFTSGLSGERRSESFFAHPYAVFPEAPKWDFNRVATDRNH